MANKDNQVDMFYNPIKVGDTVAFPTRKPYLFPKGKWPIGHGPYLFYGVIKKFTAKGIQVIPNGSTSTTVSEQVFGDVILVPNHYLFMEM